MAGEANDVRGPVTPESKAQGLAPQGLAPQDLGVPDLAPRDLAPQDLAPQDLAPQDLAPQDLAPQGLAPQDLGVPDLSVSDEGTPDSDVVDSDAKVSSAPEEDTKVSSAPEEDAKVTERFPITRMVAMVGGWVLIFFLYNTNNPLTQLITMDPVSFAWEAGALDYAIYIGGHVVALVAVTGLLCIGVGYKHARELLLHKLQKPLLPTLVFVVALVIACLVDEFLSYRLPERFLLDLPVVLEDLSYDAFRIAVTTGVAGFAQSFTRQIILMTLLALVVDSEIFRHAGLAKWPVAGLCLYLLGGLLSSSPTQGSIVFCIVANGCAELTYGWHFWRCRNLALTVTVGWVAQAVVGYVLFSLV